MKTILSSILLLAFLCSFPSSALAADRSIVKAKVLDILAESEEVVFGNATSHIQTIIVLIQEGSEKGREVTIENDYVPVQKGDSVYVTQNIDEDGSRYSLYEVNRTPALLFFAFLFLVLVFLFGGIQGLRGLLSLGGSLALIIFVFLPNILNGASPVLISVIVSSIIVIFGSYITHGFNRTTSSAVLGMVITVLLTGLLAHLAVGATRLHGLTDEDTLYLSINVGQQIDLLGLLLAGIIIGLLGVLYDTAISQAIAVEELMRISPTSDKSHIYKRALRIGREHIGAIINTLAIAYVGASLPLFLLFYSDRTVPHFISINNEIYVAEIIRTLIGSIGLILAVPITTFLAVQMLSGKKFTATQGSGHSH
jgi:uncharacterized membrane protein